MSHIPDMREKEEGSYYYQGYLDEQSANYLAGYDYAMEDTIDSFFYNLEIYLDELEECGFDDQRLKAFEKHYTEFRQLEGTNDPIDLNTIEDSQIKLVLTLIRGLIDYAEMERDEIGTSLIDSMSDEELKKTVDDYNKGYKNLVLRLEEAKQNGVI